MTTKGYKTRPSTEVFTREVKILSCLISIISLAWASPAIGNFENLAWGSNNAVSADGYLDVTKAPYSLKNTGNSADAAANATALQDAIDFAHVNNLAVFFPEGTYVIDRTLDCFNTKAALTDSYVFVGSALGARPVIQLKDWSNGFTTATDNGHKAIINFYCSVAGDGTGTEFSPAGYNFVFRGIDFDLRNNPGAVAIDLLGAQGCTIQDVDIYSTHSGNPSFWAGIKDLCGSGSMSGNILIDGGKYAFYVSKSNPAPLLVGITCLNQTTRAFYTKMQTPLTIVGFKIVADSGPVFEIQSSGKNNEHLNLIDGSVEFTGSNANFVKNNDRSIYMRNVYAKNANKISDNIQGADLVDNTGGWAHVGEYSYFHIANRRIIDTTTGTGAYGENTLDKNSSAPPADLLSRHLWDESTFPHFEDTANIVKIGPGTSGDNDAARIQAVIDSAGNKAVFLQKGDYYLEDSIHLKSNTRLFGVARNITRLHCKSSFSASSPNWGQMITTPNDANATCMIAWFALKMHNDQAKRITFMDWQAGRHSMVREVHFRKAWNAQTNNAMVRLKISENGGGRWYGLWGREANGDGEHPDHRLLLIENTTEPLALYCWTVEYQESLTYMSEIKNSENVTIYAFKCETDLSGNDDGGQYRHTPALGITNGSKNIAVFAESGLGEMDNNSSKGIIEIKGGSNDILAANLGGGWNDNTGYYIIKNFSDNVGLKKTQSGRGWPVQLYKKGNPAPVAYVPPAGGGGGGGSGGGGASDSIAFNVSPPTTVAQGSQYNISVDWSSTGDYEVEVRLMLSSSPWSAQSDTVTVSVGANETGTDVFPVTVDSNAVTTANALRWRIRLLDGQGTSSANEVINNVVASNVTATPPANTAPDLASIVNQSVDEGDVLQIPLSATDIDGDDIVLIGQNTPSFVSLMDNGDGSGQLEIAPDHSESGVYNITIDADEGNGSADSESFTLTVNEVPLVNSISFNTAPPTQVTQGEKVDIVVDWSAAGNYVVEVRLMESSSPWSAQSDTISLNVSTGASGTDTFQVTVNNDANTAANALRWRIRLLDGQGTASSNEVVSNVVHSNVTASSAGLTNPGFESNNLNGWTVLEGTEGPDAWTVSSTAANGSTYSLVLQANGDNLQVYQNFPVTPGAQYTVSGYYKPENLTGGTGGAIRADFVQADGSTWATGSETWNEVSGYISGSTYWVYYEATVTAPSDAGYLRVRLMSKDCTSGKARFDELTVNPLP